MRLRIGLQGRIIVLVMIGLSTIFGVLTYLAFDTLNESTRRALTERLAVAELVAARTDGQLRTALALLKGVATPNLLDADAQAGDSSRAQLARLLRSSPLLDYAVFVTDERGRIAWSEPVERLPVGSHLPGLEVIGEGLRAGVAQVTDLLEHPEAKAQVAILAVPILDSGGNLVGSVGSAVDLSTGRLSLLVEPLKMGNTGYAEIVDRDGRVLATSLSGRLLQKDDNADHFLRLMLDKRPTVARCHRCHQSEGNGRKVDVVAFVPLEQAPWGVALRQLEDEVLAPTNEMARRIVMVAVPLFFIALVAAAITTGRVVRPVRELTRAAERIATGDLDSALVPTGSDELGKLGAAFESMRVKLKVSYEEIAAWNRDLEHRVEERTRDLATIFEASQVISATLDLDAWLGELVPRLVSVIRQADAGVLYLKREGDELLVLRSSYGYEGGLDSGRRLLPSERFAANVLRSADPVLLTGADAVDRAGESMHWNRADWRKVVPGVILPLTTKGVSLITNGRAIGCLVLESYGAGQGFGEADLSLVQTIADRIAVAIENASLYDEVQLKEHLRGELLQKVMVAQEEERKRIARELHDETGQSLTALAISLAAAQEALPHGAVTAKNALAQAKSLVEVLISEARRLISDLRPTLLDDLGLIPALRRYVTTQASLLNMDVRLHVEGRRRRLRPQAETALFRIVQESLTNAARHGQARTVEVSLVFEDSQVVAQVRDDGGGFDVAQTLGRMASRGRGVGLLGMQERATLLGGTVQVASSPGEGTSVTVLLPMEEIDRGEYAAKGSAG